ncbi:unnamed protein product, partial [Protopolystoma xenopodis]
MWTSHGSINSGRPIRTESETNAYSTQLESKYDPSIFCEASISEDHKHVVESSPNRLPLFKNNDLDDEVSPAENAFIAEEDSTEHESEDGKASLLAWGAFESSNMYDFTFSKHSAAVQRVREVLFSGFDDDNEDNQELVESDIKLHPGIPDCSVTRKRMLMVSAQEDIADDCNYFKRSPDVV